MKQYRTKIWGKKLAEGQSVRKLCENATEARQSQQKSLLGRPSKCERLILWLNTYALPKRDSTETAVQKLRAIPDCKMVADFFSDNLFT